MQSGELFKSGVRMRLPGQSFQILHYLLEHPGDVVSRESLRNQLWGSETFVDFEHSLHVAVNRLRRALNDSAESPRYIETLPGRGYRFIGTVDPPLVPEITKSEESTEPSAVAAPGHPWKWLSGIAAALVLLVASSFYLHLRAKPVLTSNSTIVLSQFRNTTGDPAFDETLLEGLSVELEQSPFLSLLSGGRVRTTLRLMGRSSTDSLTPELAREICERTNSSAVLSGSISTLGKEYVVALHGESCVGALLDEEQEQTPNKEDVLQALAHIARRFRQRAGESLATIHQHDLSLAEASTPSLDALKAYSMAQKTALTIGFGAAVPLLKRALELDPGFATAHAYLGRIYADIGESDLSSQSTRLAYQFRDRASDHEKFFITFSYDRQVTGDLEAASRTLTLFSQIYPRDSSPHSLLSGFTRSGRGHYETVVEEAHKAIALDPDLTPAYLNLASGSLALNRFEDAQKALRAAVARKLEIPDLVVYEYVLAFVQNDRLAMDRAWKRGVQMPDAQDWLTHLASLTAAYSGRTVEARSLSKRAIELAMNSNQRERAGLYQAAVAYWEALFGETQEALEDASASLKSSNTRDVQYTAALVFQLCGAQARAQTLASDLRQRFPNDTQVNFVYLPALRAAGALRIKQPKEAIEALHSVAPYDAAMPGTSFFGFFGGYLSSYLRGLAYLALKRGPEAVSEFQNLSQHPGVVLLDPIGTLAQLQLGRAYAMCGDKAKARAAYEKFLEAWNDADAIVPVELQAKAEYRRLRH